MFQPGSFDNFPEGPPPPVPPRNPLRNDPYRLQKQGLLLHKEMDGAATSQKRPILDMIAESSRENVDAYPEFASPRHANREFILDSSDTRRTPQPDRTPHRLSFMSLSDGEDDASLVSRRSSWTNGLRRFSSLRERRTPSTVQNSGSSFKMQGDIDQAMTNLQSKFAVADADAESLRTISSYDGGSGLENTTRNYQENSRVEAWLQRGSAETRSVESASTARTDRTPKSPSTAKSPTLSIFPPTSPKTGKREYVCPLSPMNNGRDAYGNYIPTNTQDYVTARAIPNSQKSRSDVNDTQSCGQNSTSTVRLRGGGGWWNALGIGSNPTESLEKEQAEVAGSEVSHKQTPAQSVRVQSLRAQRQVGSASQYSASILSEGDGSYSGTSLAGEMANAMPQQQTKPAQFDEHVAFASISGQRLNNQPSTNYSTPRHPSSQTHSNNESIPTSPRKSTQPSYHDTRSHAGSAYKTASKTFSKTSKKAESPWAGVTYNPRPNKKWNHEPASGPPSSVAMPPPPLLQRIYTDSEVASSVGVLAPTKYRYDRPSSAAESYDDQAWDLQSLQLGESVSVVGGPRRTLGGAARSRNVPFDPEEFEAAQKRAQVEFRPLCQDVMMRHNAEMAKYERELKEGIITPEQYKRQVEFQESNKEKSLKYSAEISGYVILTSEFSILETLSSPDSYAIYHTLLSTTNPTLWSSLVQQHHNAMAQNLKPPSPSTPSTASRTSSLDTARHVAGKIVRFVLAVPGDPELKTHSMRKGMKIEGLGMLPIAWMDPLAVSGLTGLADQDGRSGSDGEKADAEEGVGGKRKYTAPMTSPRTETRDFANAPAQSRITGTTAVNTASDVPRTGSGSGSTARWTTSSEQSQLIQAKIQAVYKPIAAFPGRRESPPRKPSAKDEPAMSETGGTEVSQQSMWPQGDAQNNWWIPKGSTSLRLRGGKGKEKKAKKKKEGMDVKGKEEKEEKEEKDRRYRRMWLDGWRAEAMYAHGSF